MCYLTETEQGVFLDLYIRPSASRSKVVGEHDGRLKVSIAAPPVDGKANALIIKFFAKFFGVKKSDVQLESGETGKRKRVHITGVSLEDVSQRITAELS